MNSAGSSSIIRVCPKAPVVLGALVMLVALTAPARSFPSNEYDVQVVQDEAEFQLLDYNTTIFFSLPYGFLCNYTVVYGDRVCVNYMYSHPDPLSMLTLAIANGNLTVLDIGNKYVRIRVDSNVGYAIFNISVPQWGSPSRVTDDLLGGEFQKVSTLSEALANAKSWYYDESDMTAVINVPTGSSTVITIKWYREVSTPAGGGAVVTPQKPEVPPAARTAVERIAATVWYAVSKACSVLHTTYGHISGMLGKLLWTRTGAIIIGVVIVIAGIIGIMLARENL